MSIVLAQAHTSFVVFRLKTGAIFDMEVMEIQILMERDFTSILLTMSVIVTEG
jgi:hypothetical protein